MIVLKSILSLYLVFDIIKSVLGVLIVKSKLDVSSFGSTIPSILKPYIPLFKDRSVMERFAGVLDKLHKTCAFALWYLEAKSLYWS